MVAPSEFAVAPRTRCLEPSQRVARYLMPEIERLLAEGGITAAQLAGVAVATGPGSFTGLRIGVTVAKLLAYSLKIPLVQLDTLEIVAESTPLSPGSRVWSVLDAQRGELFVACREVSEDGHLKVVLPTQVFALANFLDRLQTGDVIARQLPMGWEQEIPAGVQLAELVTPDVMATTGGRLAWTRLRRGETTDPFELVPQYHRASAAEEKRALGMA